MAPSLRVLSLMLLVSCGRDPTALGELQSENTSLTRRPIVGDWNGAHVTRPGWYSADAASYYLRHGNATLATSWETRSAPNGSGHHPLVGDWYGEGVQRLGYRDEHGIVHLEPKAPPVPPVSCVTAACPENHTCDETKVCIPSEVTFGFGDPSDEIVVGDWNNDGIDTLGLFRDGHWRLRNTNSDGPADLSIDFGRPGDVPVVGDWNGNGAVTPGIFRPPNEWRLREYFNGYADSESANYVFKYGTSGDVPVTGDWDGDGKTTIGIVRGADFQLRNSNSAGNPDYAFSWSPAGADAEWNTREVIAMAGGTGQWLFLDPSVASWEGNSALRWSWNGNDTSLAPNERQAFLGPTDGKLVAHGKLLAVASNYGAGRPNGGVALVRVSDKALVFHATAALNFHSVEYLPDGNLVAAASTQSKLRLYDTTTPDGRKFVDYAFPDAHAVTWDPKHLVLWVLGSDAAHAGTAELGAYRYNFDRKTPALVRVATFQPTGIDARWGHDLQPLPGTELLFVTTNTSALEFDTHTGAWSKLEAPLGSSFIKAISKHPGTGQVLEVIGQEVFSDEVAFFGPDARRKRTGAQFYKARYGCPQERSGLSW